MVTKCTDTNYQMITKEQYKDLKEYWDYQRKVQYNKEIVHNMAEQFENRVYNEFGMIDIKEMKDMLWTRVKTEDYEEPRKGWVPKDPSLRFDWEGSAHMPELKIPKPKGRPVVLRAKSGWEDVFDDEEDISNR